MIRRVPIGLLLGALLAGAAAAQVELAGVLGYRGGDRSFPVEARTPGIACLIPPCVVAEASTPESEVLGLMLDVPVADGWALEALVNRQDADLRLATGLAPEAGKTEPESFELITLQVGAMRRWEGGALTPFVAAGIGVARVETSALVLTRPPVVGEPGRRRDASEGLSLSLGGGARQALGPRWGLRYEARAYWTDLPAELGGELVQIEVGLGLAVRSR